MADDKETFGRKHEDEDQQAQKPKEDQEQIKKDYEQGKMVHLSDMAISPLSHDVNDPMEREPREQEDKPEGERHRVEIGGVLQEPGTKPPEPEGSSIESAKVDNEQNPDGHEDGTDTDEEKDEEEDEDGFKPTHRGTSTRNLPKNRKK